MSTIALRIRNQDDLRAVLHAALSRKGRLAERRAPAALLLLPRDLAR